MSDLTVATTLVEKMIAKDKEGMLTVLAENVTMTTPMGPQNGARAVAASLHMFATMGAEPDMPVEENGAIFSRSDSPMGKVEIHFTVDNGSVTNIETKTGV